MSPGLLERPPAPGTERCCRWRCQGTRVPEPWARPPAAQTHRMTPGTGPRRVGRPWAVLEGRRVRGSARLHSWRQVVVVAPAQGRRTGTRPPLWSVGSPPQRAARAWSLRGRHPAWPPHPAAGSVIVARSSHLAPGGPRQARVCMAGACWRPTTAAGFSPPRRHPPSSRSQPQLRTALLTALLAGRGHQLRCRKLPATVGGLASPHRKRGGRGLRDPFSTVGTPGRVLLGALRGLGVSRASAFLLPTTVEAARHLLWSGSFFTSQEVGRSEGRLRKMQA